MFARRRPMQIEKNVALLEHDEGDYHVVVRIEHRRNDVISEDEAERILTKAAPSLLQIQRVRFGGS